MVRRMGGASRRAAGFTLLEVMAVVVILGILATITTTYVMGRLKESRIAACGVQLKTLKSDVESFNMDFAKYPEKFQDLLTPPVVRGKTHAPFIERLPRDPWKNEINYSRGGPGGRAFDVTSAGPDGAFGNEDDQSCWDED